MTQKLSGSHVTTTFSLSCSAERFVTTFTPYVLKVFDINKINLSNYPETIPNTTNTDIIYEVVHDFKCTNDILWTPAFDVGQILDSVAQYYVNLTGFETNIQNNGVWDIKTGEDCPFNKPQLTIVKANTSSTLVKYSSDPGSGLSKLGFLVYPFPYRMKTESSLVCTPDPSPILPNVSLNFDTLEIPWLPNETYSIEVDSGFVKHQEGEQYGNPAFTIEYTSNSRPELVDSTPLLKSTTGNIEYLQLNYDREVYTLPLSSGTFRLYNSNDSLVHTYHTTDSQISENNGKIVLSVTDYIDSSTQYYMLLSSNVLEDYDHLTNNAISSKTVITFNTFAPPIYSWNPGNVTETRNNRSIELTYRYSIAGNPSSSGTIRFYKGDGTLIKTFTPLGSGVTYSLASPSIPGYPYATTIKFDVQGLITENSSYYMLIDSGVFIDLDDFTNDEISNTSALSYSTDELTFPSLKSSVNTLFSSSVNARKVRFLQSSTSASATLSATPMRVKVTPATLTSTSSLSASGSYKLVLTTSAQSYIANTANTGYFNSNTISDHDIGSTYTVNFSSANGKFGYATLEGVTGFSISGTLTEVKNAMSSIAFWPTKNYTSSSSYTITVYRDGVQQATSTKSLTYSSTYNLTQVYTITTSGTWTPTAVEKYYGLMDYLVIGGGGGGGAGPAFSGDTAQLGSGGGAAGDVNYSQNNLISLSSYSVTVGAGGGFSQTDISNIYGGVTLSPRSVFKGKSGTSSSFNGVTSNGGEGGEGSWGWTDQAGTLIDTGSLNGGSNTLYSGGTSTVRYRDTNNSWIYGAGGGGAGAGGDGGNPILNGYNQPLSGGTGGAGVSNNITGTSVIYGVGGYGTKPGNTTPIQSNTYGSGGSGQSAYTEPPSDFLPNNGINGVVIIKVHA